MLRRASGRRPSCIALGLALGALGCGGTPSTPGPPGDGAADTSSDASADAPTGEDGAPDSDAYVCGPAFLDRLEPGTPCVYALPAVPPIPSNVALREGDVRIPLDLARAEGWNYDGVPLTSIRLYGTWCAKDQAGTLGTLIWFPGCQSRIIP